LKGYLTMLAADLRRGTSTGFTVELATGRDVTSGYSVGGDPVVPEVRVAGIAELPESIIHEALKFYADMAALHGRETMGGWVHEGALYLDAPTIYADGDEDAAAESARKRGELAYFHLDTMTEHTVNA